jgi:hypothetical protein
MVTMTFKVTCLQRHHIQQRLIIMVKAHKDI